MVKAHRVIGDGNLVADVPRTRTLARATMLPALLLALFAARPATAQTPLTTPADAPVALPAGDAASTSESPSSAGDSANRAAPAPRKTISRGKQATTSPPRTPQATQKNTHEMSY